MISSLPWSLARDAAVLSQWLPDICRMKFLKLIALFNGLEDDHVKKNIITGIRK